MQTHVLLLCTFSFLVSVVFALLVKNDPVEQLRFGALLFAGFVGAAVAFGWLMYPFPLS
jgi:energy-converting hydrogenase Eha subunit C